MNRRTRRGVLRSGLLLGVGLLAGCAGQSTPDGTPTTSSTPTPTDATGTPTASSTSGTESPPTVIEATLSSGEGSCGSTAKAEVAATDDGLRATGSIVAPTPCHEAVLADHGDEGSTARFRIEVTEPPGTPACVQCIGTIPFELAVTTRGTFETVVLELAGNEPTTVREDVS